MRWCVPTFRTLRTVTDAPCLTPPCVWFHARCRLSRALARCSRSLCPNGPRLWAVLPANGWCNTTASRCANPQPVTAFDCTAITVSDRSLLSTWPICSNVSAAAWDLARCTLLATWPHWHMTEIMSGSRFMCRCTTSGRTSSPTFAVGTIAFSATVLNHHSLAAVMRA